MEFFIVLLLIVIIVLLLNADSSNKTQLSFLKNEIHLLRNKVSQLIEELNKVKTVEDDLKKSEHIIIPSKIITPEISKEIIKEEIVETNSAINNKEEITPLEELHHDEEETKIETPKISTNNKPTFVPISHKTENWWEKFQKNNPDLEKFIGENLISKIGIVILVLGISFFVKFAIDNDWINEIGRLAIGILSGVILLGFAHRLQKEYKTFSSILVSGAIVVFYFTIAIGFKQYHTFSQTVAFILMVIITIFSVLISILYDRKELGILSLIGAFAVPLMVSNGAGNYIFLFTYLLIIDIGFLIVSLNRKWLIVNILSFVFTHIFLLYCIISQPLNSVNSINLLVFASLFYLTYYIVNIIRTIKEETILSTISVVLFVANTFIYFGQGIYLLHQYHSQYQGLFTILLAAINLITGWLILKKNTIDKNIVYLFIGLTLTFVTLAGPIQLNGNYITLFWAAESVLLLWLSSKTKNNDFKIGFIIVTQLMIISLLMDFSNIYNSYSEKPILLTPIVNKGFITGIFCAICLASSVYLLKKERESYQIRFFKFNPITFSMIYSICAFVVLYLTLLLEINYQTNVYCDTYTASSILFIYNFACILLYVIFSAKFDNKVLNTISVLMTVITILVAIITLYNLPITAFIESKIVKGISNTTYWLQIIIFGISLYLLYHINKNASSYFNNEQYKKYFLYFSSIAFTALLSIELVVLLLPHFVDTTSNNLPIVPEQSYIIYQAVSKATTTLIKSALPVLWGLIAFGFLYYGIKKSSKELRIFSLVLLAVTLMKLFLYDIGNVSSAGKIIAFIALGILLLVISFMYQKIKKVLFEDETITEENSKIEENNQD